MRLSQLNIWRSRKSWDSTGKRLTSTAVQLLWGILWEQLGLACCSRCSTSCDAGKPGTGYRRPALVGDKELQSLWRTYSGSGNHKDVAACHWRGSRLSGVCAIVVCPVADNQGNPHAPRSITFMAVVLTYGILFAILAGYVA